MLFTRLLTAAEYGRYALIVAGVGLVHVVMFQWLQMIIARFLPQEDAEQSEILGTVLSIFIALSTALGAIGILIVYFWSDPKWQYMLALAVPLTLAHSWLQINMTLASAQVAPTRYGGLLGVRSVLTLLVGYGLAFVGWVATAPIIGLLVGTILACVFFGRSPWQGVRVNWPPAQLMREYMAYGLPLTITFSLGWITSTSDRVLISWLIDDAATGIYAAGYDIAQLSLGVLLGIVNTAAYPLVIRKMTEQGAIAATIQLNKNGALVMTIALSGAAGLIALSQHITLIFLGSAFQNETAIIMPWIAAASAITAIKAFHFDLAFQLAKESKWQAYTSAIAALANVLLCMLLIPFFGILGAAWATLAACLLATIFSVVIGNRVFPMPNLTPLLVKAILIAALTYLGAWLITQSRLSSLSIVILGIITGAAFALAGAAILHNSLQLIIFQKLMNYIKK